MYAWVAPVLWGVCSTVGDWMMFAGLILFIVWAFTLIVRAMDALCEKGE